GTADDAGLGLALDATGRVFSTGFFQGANVDFDPTDATFTLSGNGGTDAFVWELKQKAPPTVTLLGVPSGAVSEGTVLALGASITDPDSTHVGNYAWTVTRNGESFATGTSPTLSVALPDEGTYVINLTVFDPDGNAGTTSATVLATNAAPVLDATTFNPS